MDGQIHIKNKDSMGYINYVLTHAVSKSYLIEVYIPSSSDEFYEKKRIYDNLKNIFQIFIKSKKSIEHLCIKIEEHTISLDSDIFLCICDFISKYPTLISLYLDMELLYNRCDKFIEAIKSTKIIDLNISRCALYSDEFITNVVKNINLQKLTLDYDWAPIDNDNDNDIAVNALISSKSLNTLIFKCHTVYVNDKYMNRVIKIISENKSITSLSIEGLQDTDTIKFISKLPPNITTLYLNNECEVDDLYPISRSNIRTFDCVDVDDSLKTYKCTRKDKVLQTIKESKLMSFPKLEEVNPDVKSLLEFKRGTNKQKAHQILVDMGIALYSTGLTPYVLMEIYDWITPYNIHLYFYFYYNISITNFSNKK